MLQRMVVEVVAEAPTMEQVVAAFLGLEAISPEVSISIERQIVRQVTPPDEEFDEMLKSILDNGSSL